ncbi:hypothetical protein CRUP_007623 [Coryphaenoides rupestris]|nr:hypothetical protein CRUP_007623 [Coryphaenoides rupestris]
MRSQVRGHSAPVLIWSLVACSVALWLLRALRHTDTMRAGGQKGSPAGFEPGVTEKGVNSGEATPPDEEGKSEDEEEEEEEVGEEDVCKGEPEERDGEDKNDTGDEELAAEEEDEEEDEPSEKADPGVRKRK